MADASPDDTRPPGKAPRERQRRPPRRPPRTYEEAAHFAAWALYKVGQGQMTIDEAKVITGLLKEFRDLHEAALLARRITQLEAKLAAQTPTA